MREAEKPSIYLNPDLIKPNQTHQQSPIKVEEKGQILANPIEPSTHYLDPDEMAAVYSMLMTVENLVEVKPTLVEMVCERTKLLK